MNADNDMIPDDYPSLLAEIKERVRSAQYEALRAVNKELVALYWDIGRIICRTSGPWDRLGQGRRGTAGSRSAGRVPGYRRLLASNLWRMKGFYEAYVLIRKTRTTGARNRMEP